MTRLQRSESVLICESARWVAETDLSEDVRSRSCQVTMSVSRDVFGLAFERFAGESAGCHESALFVSLVGWEDVGS